jgi:predicted nucleic acid-binding protein
MVPIKRLVNAVPEDPEDIVPSTVYEVKASYIVAGDKHPPDLGRFRGTRILNVNEMLELL